MTIEDKILKVADQLAVMSQQRIIGLEKNIADLKIKLKKKTSERAAEIKNRSVAKFLSPEKTARSDALGVGFSMEATDLLSLSETVTSCAAGPVIIPFSLDKIASWPRLSPYRNLPASASRFHLMPVLKQFRSMFRPPKNRRDPKRERCSIKGAAATWCFEGRPRRNNLEPGFEMARLRPLRH